MKQITQFFFFLEGESPTLKYCYLDFQPTALMLE